MVQRTQCAGALALVLILSGGTPRAHALPADAGPPGTTALAAAPSFRYAVACESREAFLSQLAELSGDPAVERALSQHNVDVSIVQVEPEQWTLTVQRTTTAGTQGRVLRDKSCEQLATAARVVLSVWLREESELPPSPPAQPSPPVAPPPSPAEPAAAPVAVAEAAPASSDDRYFQRQFGVSALLESASKYYVAPAAGVTGEFWTMLEKVRFSVALSYWTSLREWTGQSSPTERLQGWDTTGQIGIFLFHTPELDLGVTGSISLSWVRVDQLVNGVRTRDKDFHIRPTAAGVLLWSFARPLRLRAMLGLTRLDLDGSSTSESTELPALYAAAGIDLEL